MASRTIPSMHQVARDMSVGHGVSRAAVKEELKRRRPKEGVMLLRRLEHVMRHLKWDTADCFIRSIPSSCTDEDVVLLSNLIQVAYSGGIKGRKAAIFKWLRANSRCS